jgi:hypothetical protein
MWHTIGTSLKISQIKQRYPDVLEVALFTGKGSSVAPVSMSSGSLHLSTGSRSTPMSMVSSSKPPSEDSGVEGEDTPKVRVETIVLGDLNATKGPVTSINTLEILGRLNQSEDLEDMLSFFMSQLHIRTGIRVSAKKADVKAV